MLEITQSELEEYLALKSVYGQDAMRQSLNAVMHLEDDIDEPIKRCVAALALLGCEPAWSCCGFDYEGQPKHKRHQTGRVYFILGRFDNAVRLLQLLHDSQLQWRSHWEFQLRGKDAVDMHLDFGNTIEQWDNADCIHFSEQAVQIIKEMEGLLLSCAPSMAEEVTLKDTNEYYKEVFEFWQYSPKSDWVITKEWLLGN